MERPRSMDMATRHSARQAHRHGGAKRVGRKRLCYAIIRLISKALRASLMARRRTTLLRTLLRTPFRLAAVLLPALLLASPGRAQQTTLGGGTAGESAARLPGSYTPPTGPAPR